MRGELVSAGTLGASDLAAWSELAAEAVSPNPFFEPDFVLPALRAFQADDVQLLIVRDGSQWLAALPVQELRAWHGVPGRCLANWMHSYCFLGTPLVAGAEVEHALATLVDRGLTAASCIALSWIDADGRLAEPLSGTLGTRGRSVAIHEFDRAALRRREVMDYLEGTLSARHRGDLRRTFRRLTEEVGELTVTDRCDDPTAYEEFLALERSGWKGARGTALASVPEHARFFVEVCERFAAVGRLQLLALGNETRTLAMLCNLTACDGVFGFKAAFDEQLAKLSPGKHLQTAQVERFHHGRFAWIDSCAASDSSDMNRLWPDRRALRSVVTVRRSVSAAASYAKWRAVRAAVEARLHRHARTSEAAKLA